MGSSAPRDYYPKFSQSVIEEEKKRGLCVRAGITNGVLSAIGAGSLMGAAVYTAQARSQWFRTRLGPSGKSACVLIPMLGLFSIQAETTIIRCSRAEGEFASIDDIDHQRLSSFSPRSFASGVADVIINRPVTLLFLTGVPAVAAVAYTQFSAKGSAPSSVRLLQTRVLGQASIISLLVIIGGAGEYMKHLNKLATREDLDKAAASRQ